jgi:hypothetical protein
MTHPIRLLVSARDTGAAGHLAVVAAQASVREDLELALTAAPPALGAWQALDLPVEPFAAAPVEAADDPGVEALLAEARALVQRLRPDAILVGLSGPGAGLDEALLAVAGNIPTFVLQDYWGDLNTLLGPPRVTPLVMDDEAVVLTRRRHGVEAVAVGAPKYTPYVGLDMAALRESGRRRAGAGGRRMLVGFCGQPLWSYPGYRDTIEALGHVLSGQFPDALLVYRPHPKETRLELAAVASTLAGSAGTAAVTRSGDPEEFLAGCDVVCSAFSSCATDLLYLDRVSPTPLANGVHLLFDRRLAHLFREWTDLDAVPTVTAGLALDVDAEASLAETLAIAASPASCERTWRRARERLADPATATAAILDHVVASVRAR